MQIRKLKKKIEKLEKKIEQAQPIARMRLMRSYNATSMKLAMLLR